MSNIKAGSLQQTPPHPPLATPLLTLIWGTMWVTWGMLGDRKEAYWYNKYKGQVLFFYLTSILSYLKIHRLDTDFGSDYKANFVPMLAFKSFCFCLSHFVLGYVCPDENPVNRFCLPSNPPSDFILSGQCFFAQCPRNRDARCFDSTCGWCHPEFYIGDTRVNCFGGRSVTSKDSLPGAAEWWGPGIVGVAWCLPLLWEKKKPKLKVPFLWIRSAPQF